MEKVINTSPHIAIPTLHRVSVAQPLVWLRAGLEDMKRAPFASLGFGALFTVIGFLLMLGAQGNPWLVLTYLGGFLLVGPVAANGIYEVSRQLENHQDVNFLRSAAQCRNPMTMALYAVFLGFVLIAWVRLTSLILAISFSSLPDRLQESWLALFTTSDGLSFLLVFAGSGAIAAFVVFLTGVVTLPLVKDRNIDIVTGIVTSIRIIQVNPLPMLTWAAWIVGLTVIGLATFMIGLILIFPLLGHATWHAYRDLVVQEDEPSAGACS